MATEWAWTTKPSAREQQRDARRQMARSRRDIEVDISMRQKRKEEAKKRAIRLIKQGNIKEARVYSDRSSKIGAEIVRLTKEMDDVDSMAGEIRSLGTAQSQQEAMRTYTRVAGPVARQMTGTGPSSVMAMEQTRDRMEIARETIHDAMGGGDVDADGEADAEWETLLSVAEQQKTEVMLRASVPVNQPRDPPAQGEAVDLPADDPDDKELMQRLENLKHH